MSERQRHRCLRKGVPEKFGRVPPKPPVVAANTSVKPTQVNARPTQGPSPTTRAVLVNSDREEQECLRNQKQRS